MNHTNSKERPTVNTIIFSSGELPQSCLFGGSQVILQGRKCNEMLMNGGMKFNHDAKKIVMVIYVASEKGIDSY